MKKLSYNKLLGILTIVNIIVLVLRDLITPAGSPNINFLTHNLFLGFMPLLIAWILKFFSVRVGVLIVILVSFLWLVFYPNAPYMVTDTIHVNSPTTIQIDTQYYQVTNPKLTTVGSITEINGQATDIKSNIAIYDSLIIFLFAILSMFYGFFSLKIMLRIWEKSFGKYPAYIIAVLSIILSGLGIYIGRMANLRLNTTDLFTEPMYVIQTVIHCLVPVKDNLPTYAMIILYSLIQFSVLVMMKDLEEPGNAK